MTRVFLSPAAGDGGVVSPNLGDASTPERLFADAGWVGDYLRLNDQWRTTTGKGFYEATAEHLALSLPIAPGTHIVDLACGTGISTAAILAIGSRPASVVGIDRSLASLHVAQTCFGDKSFPPAQLAQYLHNNTFPTQFLAEVSGRPDFDCSAYICSQQEALRQHRGIVKFVPGDFLAIGALAEGSVDSVFGSHALHWIPQGGDGSVANPNRNYEEMFLRELHRVLKPNGTALFNTNADWFQFQDTQVAAQHALNHPFVRRVIALIFENVGATPPSVTPPNLYSREYLDRKLNSVGLSLEQCTEWNVLMDPRGMYVYLLTALKMVTFAVMPPDCRPSDPKQQAAITCKAIHQALQEGYSPDSEPFTYAMVDLVVRRR